MYCITPGNRQYITVGAIGGMLRLQYNIYRKGVIRVNYMLTEGIRWTIQDLELLSER